MSGIEIVSQSSFTKPTKAKGDTRPDSHLQIVTYVYEIEATGAMFAQFGTGRLTIAYPVLDLPIGYSNLFANRADLDVFLNSEELTSYLNGYTGRYGNESSSPRPVGLNASAPDVCMECGIGKVKVALEAYGDRATCSHCDYESYVSIGD